MKKPKSVKSPSRSITLILPEKAYQVYARAVQIIEREYGEPPSMEHLLAEILGCERNSGRVAHYHYSRRLSKSDKSLVELVMAHAVMDKFLGIDKEIKKRIGTAPGFDDLIAHVMSQADSTQLVEEFSNLDGKEAK